MPDFSPVITLAYVRILSRPPDPGGLESYNRAMNSGLTEAQMRESLLRSSEYASNNPDRAAALAARAGKGSSRKKGGKRARKSR
ncbi:MAG: DUF4214 domain-containing protein [Acidobacteria bacterium]|nr:DUF4214 domain-containing protein [Acidobacteriota bacterium]